MKRLDRADLLACIPFSEDWKRQAIHSLYVHAGIPAPAHLRPGNVQEGRSLPRGDRQ